MLSRVDTRHEPVSPVTWPAGDQCDQGDTVTTLSALMESVKQQETRPGSLSEECQNI